jgi:HD-GYP domain-containing protein (c-di-GMP phosphodiesterase class II)
MLIANAIELSHGEKIILLYSAMFHDVGKIEIPEKILNKKSRLTKEEYAEIKKHSQRGYEVLKCMHLHEAICETVLHHHERYDGRGYPDGLTGEKIPQLSRIIGVADAFDAMTSDRAYRKALSFETATNELINNKGTQLDPVFVDVFIKQLNKYHEGVR